jgi:hypothetical protein
MAAAMVLLALWGTTDGEAVSRNTIRDAARRVSADNIRRHAAVLASDALEGRAPGTTGGARAADYIARELEALGVVPFGDGASYFQQVPFHGSRALPTSRLVLTSLGESARLTLGEDYLLFTMGSQTLVPRPVPLVFVGYGIVAPEFDYSDYADVDVRGKVVVFLGGEPPSSDPEYFLGKETSVYAAPETKQRIALSRGAVGSILIPTGVGDTDAFWRHLRREFSFEHLSLAYTVPRHLSLVLHPDRAKRLFADALYDFDRVMAMHANHTLRSFHLPVTVRFEGQFQSRDFLAPNVVGLIEGGDPELKGTYVVVSAHYDHLGIGPAVDGDSIYNGLVDNALGVAGVLEIARVLRELPRPPARSIILLFSTAEEEGNLGTSFFLDRLRVPLARVVANINVDGLAFFEPFSDVIGIGSEYSDLGDIVIQTARIFSLEVSEMPAVMGGHAAFARSDQSVFAEAGVPSILVNEGFRWRFTRPAEALDRTMEWFDAVYHSPKDDLEQPLDFDASRQHAALILALVLRVADSATAPQWRPGAPYAYQRLLTLAEENR